MFPKTDRGPSIKLLANGIVRYEGEKCKKHRKIKNPAFLIEKLKELKCNLSNFKEAPMKVSRINFHALMLRAFDVSCNAMVSKWEKMILSKGSCEINVWPHLQTLTADVLSRTAFGSNYEDGKIIFFLQREQTALLWRRLICKKSQDGRSIPTESKKRMGKIRKKIQGLLRDMISKRIKIINTGGIGNNDVLDIPLNST